MASDKPGLDNKLRRQRLRVGGLCSHRRHRDDYRTSRHEQCHRSPRQSVFAGCDGGWKHHGLRQCVCRAHALRLRAAHCGAGARWRLTLTAYSTTPPTNAVMTADVTAAGAVYYAPYFSQSISVWNGSAFTASDIGPNGLSLNLHTAVQTTAGGPLYDMFAETIHTGTLELCTRPGRSSGRGVVRLAGVWVNQDGLTCTNSSSDAFTCPIFQCTYLGTMYAVTDGKTAMQFGPLSASGGAGMCLCLFNAYNRVPLVAESLDSEAAYSDNANTWQPMNSTHSGGTLT